MISVSDLDQPGSFTFGRIRIHLDPLPGFGSTSIPFPGAGSKSTLKGFNLDPGRTKNMTEK